jgi:hypothetical protein
MKRSEIEDPRLISWIRLHSEKDECAHNPNEMAKGIFMVDALAVLENKTVKTLGSTRLITVQVATLELKNIMNEIILMNEWHFRTAVDLNLPILDDPANYQHQMQLGKITVNRDISNSVQPCSSLL